MPFSIVLLTRETAVRRLESRSVVVETFAALLTDENLGP